MNPETFNFDWKSVPNTRNGVFTESYYMSSKNNDICVRFSPVRYADIILHPEGNPTKKVTIHFTGKTGAGLWAPWGAWDDCILQGDDEDKARMIWNKIADTGNYVIGKPVGWEKAKTAYKNSQWEQTFVKNYRV